MAGVHTRIHQSGRGRGEGSKVIMLRHKRKIAFFFFFSSSLSFSKVHFLGHCIAFITVFEDIWLGRNNASLSLQRAREWRVVSTGVGGQRPGRAGEEGGDAVICDIFIWF